MTYIKYPNGSPLPNAVISGGTVLAEGSTNACNKNLKVLKGIMYSNGFVIMQSDREDGDGATVSVFNDIVEDVIRNDKYLRVSSSIAHFSSGAVSGVTDKAIAETQATITYEQCICGRRSG